MRYFDRTLSEELDQISKDKIHDLFKRWFHARKDDKKQEEVKRLRAELDEWREKAPEDFKQIFAEVVEKNKHDPRFKKELEKMHHDHTDNIATWMLRHLVNKAQSG